MQHFLSWSYFISFNADYLPDFLNVWIHFFKLYVTTNWLPWWIFEVSIISLVWHILIAITFAVLKLYSSMHGSCIWLWQDYMAILLSRILMEEEIVRLRGALVLCDSHFSLPWMYISFGHDSFHTLRSSFKVSYMGNIVVRQHALLGKGSTPRLFPENYVFTMRPGIGWKIVPCSP